MPFVPNPKRLLTNSSSKAVWVISMDCDMDTSYPAAIPRPAVRAKRHRHKQLNLNYHTSMNPDRDCIYLDLSLVSASSEHHGSEKSLFDLFMKQSLSPSFLAGQASWENISLKENPRTSFSAFSAIDDLHDVPVYQTWMPPCAGKSRPEGLAFRSSASGSARWCFLDWWG